MISPTTLVIAAGMVFTFAVGAGTAWTVQGRTIDTLKLETANERIATARANRIVVERATLKLAQAQQDYARDVDRARGDRRNADTVFDGLRDDTAAAVRDAGASAEACIDKVATLKVISDQCAGAVVDMATDAQDWYLEAVRQNNAP